MKPVFRLLAIILLWVIVSATAALLVALAFYAWDIWRANDDHTNLQV